MPKFPREVDRWRSENRHTLSMAIPGALFAIPTIIALSLTGLYMAVQRAFVRGRWAGAVKG